MRAAEWMSTDVTGTRSGQSTPASISYTNHTCYPRRWETWEWICSSRLLPANCRSSRKSQRFLAHGFDPLPRQPAWLERMSADFRRAVQRKVRHGPTWPWWAATTQRGGGSCTGQLVRSQLVSPEFAGSWPSASTNVNKWASRPALDRRGNPPSSPACSMRRSAPTGAVDLAELAAPGNRFADDASFLERWHSVREPGQTAAGEHHPSAWGVWWIPASPVRCAGESGSRIQAPAPGPALQDRRALPAPAQTVRICRAHLHSSVEGGPGLRMAQADYSL